MSDNGANDFLVELNEFVVIGDSNHSDYENFFDLLSLLFADIEFFGLPTSLNCVFELDESGLFDGLIYVGVIDDFHESHAIA